MYNYKRKITLAELFETNNEIILFSLIMHYFAVFLLVFNQRTDLKRHYTSKKNYLKELEASSINDALCQFWLKSVQFLWSRRCLNFFNVFS